MEETSLEAQFPGFRYIYHAFLLQTNQKMYIFNFSSKIRRKK